MDVDKISLEASKLVKKFGKTIAVDDVSLSLRSGECLAILGSNGAGKTTICEMLEGLIAPDSGDISYAGKSFKENRKEILETIGVQLQETSLYKKYTVRETLDLFGSFYKKRTASEDIIAQFDLTSKANARLESLSGGQKQRVYLGCAIINDPEVLFLDEPTTGLDPQARRNIWDVVAQLKRDGRSVLMTTHYMEEAEVLADRVAIMDHGKIIAEGTPDELIRKVCLGGIVRVRFANTNKSGGSVREFSEISKLLEGSVRKFDEGVFKDGVFEIITPDAGLYVQDLIRSTDALDLRIDDLSLRSGTLEDVFMKLTGRRIVDA